MGKILGFFLGQMLLGPLGAVLGLLIGAFFDHGLQVHHRAFPQKRTAEVQNAFFRTTFLVMGHIAKADGRVSEQEIFAARQIMDQLELNASLRREAMALFTQGKEPSFQLQAVLSTFWEICAQQKDLLRFFMEIQLEAALADGVLQETKQRILAFTCNFLRFSPQEFDQIYSRFWAEQAFYQWYADFTPGSGDERARRTQTGGRDNSGHSEDHYQRGHHGGYQSSSEGRKDSLQNAYGVLGVSIEAAPPEVKKAYRRLMNQHHPDKLAARGLPESMLKKAKEKTQQITAAYHLIREARGFR